MHGGEMLNLALSICPEAAGFEKGSTVIPQYTGENLFELMEYKRFLDRRTEHPQFQMVKFYLPVYADFYPENSDGLDVTDLTGKDVAIRSNYQRYWRNRDILRKRLWNGRCTMLLLAFPIIKSMGFLTNV